MAYPNIRMAQTEITNLNDLADRPLLERFIQQQDDEAFRVLVERHGPLVLSVCRRSLYSATDAEDAFQATFLVLTQSAHKIRRGESVASWLYGVAARVSSRMRKRRPKETLAVEEPSVEQDPLYELLARHDARVVDEELTALPVALRTPLVLRYLVGKSNTEVAKELGITVAALEGRLKRGKQKLRVRLLRRGIVFTALVSTLQATQVTAGELPTGLVAKTLDVCVSGSSAAGGSSAPASSQTSSNPIIQLAQEEITAMKAFMLTKSSAAVVTLSSVAVLAVAVQLAVAEGKGAQAGGQVALQATASNTNSSAEAQSAPAVVRVSHTEPVKQGAPKKGNPFDSVSEEADPFGSAAFASAPEKNDPFAPKEKEIRSPPSSPPVATNTKPPKTASRQFADSKPRSQSEQHIEAALLQNTMFDFYDTPLEEVMAYLADEHGMSVVIDERALDDLAISPDVPVTLNVKDVMLESGLRLMLSAHDLTFIVKNEVLLITTTEEAASTLETRVYPYPTRTMKPEMLQQVIAPGTWAEAGTGEGSVVIVGDQLIVRQTYGVHAEINELLLQLQ